MGALREEIRHTLRMHLFVESKSVVAWWTGLGSGDRGKVVKILGLSKVKDFSKLSPGEKSEVEAYFLKHKGKIV